MKLGATIALLIGLALAWAGMAHDHPPPVTCVQLCDDTQCKCVDACTRTGKPSGDPCFYDCWDRKEECHSRCNLTLEDCRNTDRCSRPRG